MTLYIEQTNDNYIYKIQLQQSQDESKEKPATNLPLPGQSAESNIPLAFEGETKTFDINFIIYNNDEDKAKIDEYNSGNTTCPDGSEFTNDTIVTLMEQKQWLEQYIHKENLGINWKLHDDSNDLLYKSWNVHLESVKFTRDKDSPHTIPATISLKVGKGV